jgi:uncharacterized protein
MRSRLLRAGIVLGLFICPTISLAYYAIPPAGQFIDTAPMFTPEIVEGMNKALAKFERETGAEIAVLTIPSLKGDSIENFALRTFEDWGIGKKFESNGVLLLISTGDRSARLQVGYGLEPYITDAYAYSLLGKISGFGEGQHITNISGLDILLALEDVENIIRQNTPGATIENESVPLYYSIQSQPFILLILYFILLNSIIYLIISKLGYRSWWFGGVIGGFFGYLSFGLVIAILLAITGLCLDYFFYKKFDASRITRIFGGAGTGGISNGPFGGFGGGNTGGGGASIR